MLLASDINTGNSTLFGKRYISSLEDTNEFLSERIGSGGTFDCYLGEEVTINDGTYNALWQVVGVDTELGKGDIPMTQHHISLVPKTIITTSKMHTSNTDCYGYARSGVMVAATIPSIVTHLESILGDHLLTRRVKLTNATSSGTSPRGYMASANGYYSVKANLMCQMQVYGIVNSSYGNSYDTGDDTEQLPGFKTNLVSKSTGDNWWLRDVRGQYSSGSYYGFSIVRTDGILSDASTDSTYGVRPIITIG